MNYARFGWGGSDVYVYEDVGGTIVCAACKLNGTVELDESSMFGVSFPPSWHTPTAGLPYDRAQPDRRLPARAYGEMIAHLSEHEAAGHVVPPKAFTRLDREMREAIAYEMEQ